MTTGVDALILRYLQDLEAELRDLPANRRQELMDEVGEHIATARAGLDPETEAGVRSVLERLDDPADIAAEARERFGVPAAPAGHPVAGGHRPGGAGDPFLGWIVGVVLVWLSRRWTTRDKVIGTIGGMSWLLAGLGTIVASGAGGPVLEPGDPSAGVAPVGATGLGPIELLLFVLPFVLPVAAAIYLGFRLRAHAAA
jgi:hypothetical protein